MQVRVSMQVRKREDVDSCVFPALESLLKPDKVTHKSRFGEMKGLTAPTVEYASESDILHAYMR